MNHILAGLIGFIVGVVAGFVVLVSVIHHAAVKNCQQIEVVKHGLVLTLGEASRFSASSPVRGAAEKRASATFYRDALDRLKPRHC